MLYAPGGPMPQGHKKCYVLGEILWLHDDEGGIICMYRAGKIYFTARHGEYLMLIWVFQNADSKYSIHFEMQDKCYL